MSAGVAEVGTHDDLMARRGQYAELYGIPSRRVSLTLKSADDVMQSPFIVQLYERDTECADRYFGYSGGASR